MSDLPEPARLAHLRRQQAQGIDIMREVAARPGVDHDGAASMAGTSARHAVIDPAARAALMRQQPAVLWFTGLSGAGKSTIAVLVEERLHALGRHTYLLDGDDVRRGLNRDLGFTDADRAENIRRVAEVARLMVDAGLIVIATFISPFRADRERARRRFAAGEFIEIHVDTPLAVAEQRDAKGLYARARRGELTHFTGIDSPYEAPESPELRLDTTALGPGQAADRVIDLLRQTKRLDG